MSAVAKPFLSAEEYLRRERLSTERSEYHNGELLLMAGGRYRHNRAKDNFVRALGRRYGDGPCFTLSSDMRVRISETNSYVYPDVVILCEEPVLEAGTDDVLMNPKVIVEVLSPSTELYDRGEKFDKYRTIPSLMEYILISQKSPHCYRFTRLDDGGWKLDAVAGIDGILELLNAPARVPLAEIYLGVNFEESD